MLARCSACLNFYIYTGWSKKNGTPILFLR